MRLRFLCLVILGFSAWLAAQRPTREGFDVVIVNGHIMDGTGSPWYSGDVGIRAGRIAAIGNLKSAARAKTIDARGKVVAPGFIDMLGQSEMTMLVDPRLPSKIFQGITSEITGEGSSAAPLSLAMIAADSASYDHYRMLHLEIVRSRFLAGATKERSSAANADSFGKNQMGPTTSALLPHDAALFCKVEVDIGPR